MNKSLVIDLVAAIFLAVTPSAEAQHAAKIPRVGFLGTLAPSFNSDRLNAFRQGLRELGYEEGKNIVIEYRWADGLPERLAGLAAELVGAKVEVIVASGPTPTRAAKAATSTTPIVMAWDYDPVANGFVASLAQPGGNVTGHSILAPEISGKQLELMKETVPRLSKAAAFGSPRIPGNADARKITEAAAKALGVRLQYLDIIEPKDIEPVFQRARSEQVQGAVAFPIRVLFSQRQQVADLAIKNRLPVIYGEIEQVDDGGLMAYAVSIPDLFRRAAIYVDKILKGRKPTDLPIEQPKKFEFVFNLKAAKQIGLVIPPNVLARADRVIK